MGYSHYDPPMQDRAPWSAGRKSGPSDLCYRSRYGLFVSSLIGSNGSEAERLLSSKRRTDRFSSN